MSQARVLSGNIPPRSRNEIEIEYDTGSPHQRSSVGDIYPAAAPEPTCFMNPNRVGDLSLYLSFWMTEFGTLSHTFTVQKRQLRGGRRRDKTLQTSNAESCHQI